MVISADSPDEPAPPTEPSAPAAPSLAGLLALVSLVIVACVASAWTWRVYLKDRLVAATILQHADDSLLGTTLLLTEATPLGVASPEPAAKEAPTWKVKHDGYVPLPGGILTTPKSFEPDTDEYDLVIHFHGDVQIVRESVEYANLNAALAIVNWGLTSGPYREAYQEGGSFERLLDRINDGLRARGMQQPKLRRLALVGWSAGYGAIESILETRENPHPDADPLDAIITLDGVHAGYIDKDPGRIAESTVRAFTNAANAAVAGQIMLSMTHSEVTPVGYASTQRTMGHLLDQLGVPVHTGPMLPMPPGLSLPSARNAASGGVHRPMIPTSDTRKGMLRVQGFKGDTKAHHTAHLTQMAAVSLPDLVARWRR